MTNKTLPFRIGTGIDVHAFAKDRPLILGGIEVPHDRGLAGHSDADVLIHAIMDAFLGALALGDIGQHFPDTDPQYKGADSVMLLQHVYALIQQKGYVLGNVDAVVVAERPKLKPHLPKMQQRLAEAIQVDPHQISLKATTSEKLGFTGKEEGILVQATALLTHA